MNDRLVSIVSSDEVASRILGDAVRRVSAAEGSLLLVTPDGRALRFVIAHSPSSAVLIGREQTLERGVTSVAFRYQQPMVVNDTADEVTFDPSIDQQHVMMPIGVVFCITELLLGKSGPGRLVVPQGRIPGVAWRGQRLGVR